MQQIFQEIFNVKKAPCRRKVMLDGGNAIDSAIATMYCNTVVNSQSMGIGSTFSSLPIISLLLLQVGASS